MERDSFQRAPIQHYSRKSPEDLVAKTMKFNSPLEGWELIEYSDRTDKSIRPTWLTGRTYVNDEHSKIFGDTSDIPGWQNPGDTYKLYEMAHFVGDVILEIGMYSGRSAIVQINGALSNPQRESLQFFGVDIAPPALSRTQRVLQQHGLEQHTSLFCGSLSDFARQVSITPTMVFLDGDHSYEAVHADLEVLSWYLAENTPILCHDFTVSQNETGEYGVRKACQEWEERGYLRFMGVFGCSALYLTSTQCRRQRGGLPDSTFKRGTQLIEYPDRCDNHPRPTWPLGRLYVNDEHPKVFEQTSDIPGCLTAGETYKLFEMAHFTGDVILEVGGTSSRSAVVQIKGALSNPQRKALQYFSVGIDPKALQRTQDLLESLQLGRHANFYCGGLAEFFTKFSITPSMVFLNGYRSYETLRHDLELLSHYLAGNTPLLCGDYNAEGDDIRRACKEWEESGFLRFMGVFGCSALFLTAAWCQRPRGGLPCAAFQQAQTTWSQPKPRETKLACWRRQLLEALDGNRK